MTGDRKITSVTPKLGVRMSPNEAKAYVDGLNKKVMQRWDERVTKGPFMTPFLEGKLALSAIKLFFKNWGNFTVEINTLIAASYHKHIGFFKRHPDLLGPLGAKIADEFIHPRPPGHVLVMLQTAEALGLSKDQILREPMLPEARAILDFKRCLLWEGTVAEWWFSMLTEEPIGHWAASWFKSLTAKYGFTPQHAVYFSTHEEADLKEHDGDVMGHGSFNRMVMQRILEDGYADTREGYNLEYCAMAAVDLYGVMHRAAVELGS
jgi:pyrroloquinoline quinone (PQQ) biosynthesis protein C